MDLYNLMYKPMMMDNIHIEAPDMFRHADDYPEKCLKRAKECFDKYGDKLCALIVEPLLQGAGGMRMYPKEYLKALYDCVKSTECSLSQMKLQLVLVEPVSGLPVIMQVLHLTSCVCLRPLPAVTCQCL